MRVNGDRGVILIEFPAIRRELRQIAERRVAGAWRIAELNDTFVGDGNRADADREREAGGYGSGSLSSLPIHHVCPRRTRNASPARSVHDATIARASFPSTRTETPRSPPRFLRFRA